MSTSRDACALGISRETLSAWRDRVLPDGEAGRIAQHVAQCPACQRRLDQYARIATALQRTHEPDLRLRTWRGIQAQLATRARGPRPLRLGIVPHGFGSYGGIGATALVALIALLALVIFAQRPTTQPGPGGAPGPATATSTPTAPPTATSTPTLAACPNFPSGYSARIPNPGYTTTTVYADIPLPSYSRIIPDDASGGVRGYVICSAGTAASITSYMSDQLTALGWAAQGGGVWKKNGYSLTVQVPSPTNWTISWRDPDVQS